MKQLCTLALLIPHLTFSQVPVAINSGNPIFPFPQFSAYEYAGGHRLENLGNQNADGLVHAEMEKRIREAWLIMSNRFIYDGTTHAGVPYIKSNEGCPYDCSEGAGYAMIAAAYMGDKTIFDGIWFREHDIRLVKHPRYQDGVIPRPGYLYGENALAEPGGDSAADGDVDIALGLLMAWRQWGDDSGYLASNGTMISYKEEALNVIRGLVEFQNQNFSPGDCRSVSGIIGLDGYFKGGNTWKELTEWANNQDPCPEFAAGGSGVDFDGDGTIDDSGGQLHVDYVAPAYFKAFGDFLEAEGEASDLLWNVPQLRRGEVSSDWFMGELYNQGPNTIPVAGWVSLDSANNATFTNFNEGEDFRYAWRTILNHTWHGDPNVSWNPITHQVVNGGNSFNKDMGERFSAFMADPSIAGNPCVDVGGIGMSFQGPSQLVQYYDPNTGNTLGAFPINWLVGTGTPSSVSAQNFDLMGQLYRQCAIEWDQSTGQNLDSTPIYFHGFFRLLGMLVTTGNFQSPMSITPEANLKIYAQADKTFAFTGDEVTFTFSYRNYGSVAAQNSTISDVLPLGLEFVSATGGGIHAGGTVRWNIGTIPGYTSAGGITPTTGEVTVTCRVSDRFSGSVCNPATIATSSGTGWTSNRFPNNVTAVMEQNCVDIVEKALEIEKTVDYNEVNPGDMVTYTVAVKNSSKGGYLNGGRSGVNFSYARTGSAKGSTQGIKVRLFHGAAEPYINYENYRISLFLNDNTYHCLVSETACDTGWALRNTIYEGGAASGVTVSQEDIVPGSNAQGNWNQRVIIQFSDQLSGPTPHLLRYFGTPRIHEGGEQPLRAVWDLFTNNFGATNWGDDWSWDVNAEDGDAGLYFPITNDWTAPDNPDQIVSIYHNEACQIPTKTVSKILVEEWDGYTWRRIYGTGPVPGRDVDNVVFTDILPLGFTLVDFVSADPLQIPPTTSILADGRTEIRWEAPRLQIGQDIVIAYRARADFSNGNCQRVDELQTNTASVTADNESPIIATAEVTVTCDPIILPPPPSSMTKIVTPISAAVGDEVTYTLAYENTNGSPIEVPLTTASDWTAQNGALMNIAASTLTTTANDDAVSTYNFSHGTNGTLEATITFADNAAFGFAMRHTGGAKANGLYIVFKPNSGGGSVQTIVYDGLTELDTTVLGFPGNPMNIKLLLSGDQLSVWLGNTTSPIPSWNVTGLPVRAGNCGFINGFPDGSDSYALHTVTQFKSTMDSAFNLQITDPIPSEVSFVSATDGGVVSGGILNYPLIPGPILAGEITTYTWTALVASCPSETSKIVNLAYTNILGIPENTIRAQALVDCSGIDICMLLPDAPSVTDAVFCLNDPTKDLNTYITATETIVWYADNRTIIPIATPSIDTSVALNDVFYIAQQDANGCVSDRVPMTVQVVTVLAGSTDSITIDSNTNVQYDLISGFSVAPGSFSWVATDNPNITGETSTEATNSSIDDLLVNTTAVPQTVRYTITTTSSGTCGNQIFELEVTVNPKTSVSLAINNVIEGDDFEITLALDMPATEDITLAIGFMGITADVGDMALNTLTTITIPAGALSTSFNYPTLDDTLVETDETVTVFIDSVVTGTIGDTSSTVIGTLYDNDGIPKIVIKDATAEEGNPLQVTVRLTNTAVDDVTLTTAYLDLETSSTDYDANPQQITIPAGQLEVVFRIATTDDMLKEGNENFTITAGAIISGTVSPDVVSGTAEILDNDDNVEDGDNTENTMLFPLFFTPNQDGYHDFWQVDVTVVQDVKAIHIFDRYGKLLKQLSAQSLGWDGVFNGDKMPSADYWFMAEMTDGTQHQGHFSLVR